MARLKQDRSKFRRVGIALIVLLCSIVVVTQCVTPHQTSMIKAALDPMRGSLLKPLLQPRVPGTAGALIAREHIVSNLRRAGWDVELHNFVADTPHGEIDMANVVAHRPRSVSANQPRLTLAAHYDSKKTPAGFVGAIDSAFPCALLLYLASIPKTPVRDFDLIFFDGEEAFETWSATDSIYGARALAQKQSQENSLPQTLVLLDLLGSKTEYPIPSWFAETAYLHKELASINSSLVGGPPVHHYAGLVEDDHTPFLKLGVPILHLIPLRFPKEWHTIHDNESVLHWDSMEQWAKLMETWLFPH